MALLCEAGAAPDAADQFGATPLLLAAAFDKLSAAQALLECGARPDAATAAGESPLQAAQAAGHADLASLLKAWAAAAAAAAAGKRARKAAPPRAQLLHPRRVARAPPLPRLSVAALAAGGTAVTRFADLATPLVLDGAMRQGEGGWGALSWVAASWYDGAARLWPEAQADFAPDNKLHRASRKLTEPFGSAAREVRGPRLVCHLASFAPSPALPCSRLPPYRLAPQVTIASGASDAGGPSHFALNASAPSGRYLLQRLTPPMWEQLVARGDVPARLPPSLDLGHSWVDECFAGAPGLASEWHVQTHWKALLAGSRGAGMCTPPAPHLGTCRR